MLQLTRVVRFPQRTQTASLTSLPALTSNCFRGSSSHLWNPLLQSVVCRAVALRLTFRNFDRFVGSVNVWIPIVILKVLFKLRCPF